MNKRELDIVVISDIHLATFGCHAIELIDYLQSIKTNTLILNGDIIDCWNFSKRYFPLSHFDILKEIINIMDEGTKVIYIYGNHESNLRKYGNIQLGNLIVCEEYIIEIDNKKHWFFHGDAYDLTTKGWAIILAKLGGYGYDLLIIINRFINYIMQFTGRRKISLSKKVKDSVKNAVKFINNFEETICELASEKGFDYVICGHIHSPANKVIKTSKKDILYLNSGDWIENLTSLEYVNGKWSLFNYK